MSSERILSLLAKTGASSAIGAPTQSRLVADKDARDQRGADEGFYFGGTVAGGIITLPKNGFAASPSGGLCFLLEREA
ncbi:hypothetical protein X777_02870 [Ooceraea biroi]|uniref:Uncharacterized protein n=1 Tax=Ooceraea biroi TaxID=2015173 RepID=A0A026WJM6_OOCBI|nr:hypothetical protein X777_02870 [Ooceraea biroi]